MGKIFGICDNPVSTIESAIRTLRVEPPVLPSKILSKNINTSDKFISKENQPKSKAFIKMRNGFGKLMAHFSHPNVKNK